MYKELITKLVKDLDSDEVKARFSDEDEYEKFKEAGEGSLKILASGLPYRIIDEYMIFKRIALETEKLAQEKKIKIGELGLTKRLEVCLDFLLDQADSNGAQVVIFSILAMNRIETAERLHNFLIKLHKLEVKDE